MKLFLILVLLTISIFGCKSDDKNISNDQHQPMMGQQMNPQSTSAQISIADKDLLEIDSGIKDYSNKLNTSLKNYDADKSLKNKSELIESYIRYADYM